MGILISKSQVKDLKRGSCIFCEVEWKCEIEHERCIVCCTGWRKISFYFNLSFEIKDKNIEFDEGRNVLRAEFVVRAHMQ